MMRWVRALWPLVFLLPLGIIAGHFCYINLVDPAYHGLLWLHERLVAIIFILATISIVVAAYRFVRLQDGLRLLLSFRSATPHHLERIFLEEARMQNVRTRIEFIDVPARFCFTIFYGPSIIISRGFVDQLQPEQLVMVAKHEILHVQRRDPWRSIAWHIFFAALMLPGFEALDTVLHLRRERAVDGRVVQQIGDARGYQQLLEHSSRRRDKAHGAICSLAVGAHGQGRDLDQSPAYLWQRSFPALVSVVTIGLVVLSHSFFLTDLPYLQQHHC
ncbi:MAG: hypothetical protein M3160_06885 [Candidatus Eremiobacteraeota bacterium]|nr:hypothetical protein [Candidatus Eremiobacteraeota bacterium]